MTRPASPPAGIDAGERAFRALHGKVRVHDIAADPVAWDYAPSGKNVITGLPLGEKEATWDQQAPTASATCTRSPSLASTRTRRSRTS